MENSTVVWTALMTCLFCARQLTNFTHNKTTMSSIELFDNQSDDSLSIVLC